MLLRFRYYAAAAAALYACFRHAADAMPLMLPLITPPPYAAASATQHLPLLHDATIAADA